jgi:8-oxo-dGTP pyrophosphatase MutT (NUDIX family)
MSREIILSSLYSFTPESKEKERTLNDMIKFINNNEDCFSRRNIAGHVTGSAWLTSGDSVLLTHHKKLNKWLQLGGHCDGDPDVFGVAKREAIEESGILDIYPNSREIFDIDIHYIPSNAKEKGHYHYDVRYHFETAQKKYTVSHESNDLRWFSIEELMSGDYEFVESVQNLIDIWLSRVHPAYKQVAR